MVTPARAAAHFVSSEQSNAAGLGSDADALAPHTYGLPCWLSAASRKFWVVRLGVPTPGVPTLGVTAVSEVPSAASSEERSGVVAVPVAPAEPVSCVSSEVRSGEADDEDPLSVDISDVSALEFDESSAPLLSLPVSARASLRSDERPPVLPSLLAAPRLLESEESDEPPMLSALSADWVFIASVSNDAKFAPFVAPDPAVAPVEGEGAAPTC